MCGPLQASRNLHGVCQVVDVVRTDHGAVGLFELSLLTIAPTIFKNDHWIEYLTGQPAEWIPAHNTRLLHPNTLLRLLRSELEEHYMKQWAEVQWQRPLHDDLEMLRKLDEYYAADVSVIQLKS